MDQRAVNRFGMAIMVFWLILVLVRIMFYSSIYDGGNSWFGWVFNAFLIGGILIMAAIAFRGLFGRAVAKVNAEGRCQYCYAKLDPEDEFCPVCGAEEPRMRRFGGSS